MAAFITATAILCAGRSAFHGLRCARPRASLALAAPPRRGAGLTTFPGRARGARATTTTTTTTMRVAGDGDGVQVHYTGFLDDGSQFDSSRERGTPLSFVVGAGTVIRGFDDAVRGLQVGESRRTRIEAERGYGERSDDMVVKIPRSRVPEGMEVVVGSKVPLSNGMMAVVLGADAEEIELDANHELAGKALTFDMELVGFEEGVLGEVGPGMERAVFGLGCFWGAELAFQRVAGVVATRVGYTHGQTEKPTYEQVCSGRTGHAEAVAVDFDPARVSFEQLVEVFWERLGQSAMTPNQVGNDVGTQYRSGIYVQSSEQERVAEESKRKARERFGKDTVVEIESAEGVPFYLAEEYHQQYLEKGGQSAAKDATETIRCYG